MSLLTVNKGKINKTNNNEENSKNEEKVNKVVEKSEAELKKEEKYFKLVDNCLLTFKDKLRIMKRNYENDTIKIFIEVLKNGEKELIHLKNVMFYTHDELINNLIINQFQQQYFHLIHFFKT